MGNLQEYPRNPVRNRRAFLFLGFLVMTGLMDPAEARRPQQEPIVLIPGETVYVEIIQSTVTHQPGFSWSDSGSSDRFFKFSDALKTAFSQREVPLNIKIVRWGADVPKGATTATLTLMRWDRNVMGEIEARIIVQLKKAGSKVNLGVFVGTDNAIVAGSGSMEERNYQSAAIKAASRFADRMNEQINF
ncbi:MAG: hypothetical protein R3F07_00385 [Opitutaceae bacterium]